MSIQKGDIYYADLRPVIGSEQGGIRPVLVIQNDMGNRYSPTVIVAAITSQTGKHKLPTHIPLEDSKFGLRRIPSFFWSRCVPLTAQGLRNT